MEDKYIVPRGSELSNFKVPTLKEIREARKKRFVISVFTVYGDDSSDEKDLRTFAVAGIIGTQEQWDLIKPAWIECTGGKIFHATDCKAGRKVYKGIPKNKRDEEYKNLTNILAQSELWGLGISIDIAGFKRYLPDAKKYAPYYNCFSRVVMGLAEFGYKKGPRKKTKFVFDRNNNVEFNSIYMANYLSQLSEYEWSSYIDEVGFGSNDMIEIQVADLFAHETFKYYDNQLDPIKRKIRKSLEALINTKRFKIRYQDFDYFKEISEILVKLEQDDPFWREEYHQWLLEHRLIDNESNRIRYLQIRREELYSLIVSAP